MSNAGKGGGVGTNGAKVQPKRSTSGEVLASDAGQAGPVESDPFAQQAEKHRANAAEHEQRAADSFARSDTDGFVSQWASGISAQLERARADIAENGGKASFPALHLRNDDGTAGPRVAAKLIDTRYGRSWAFCDTDGEFVGFQSAFPKRESTMAKKGFVEADEEAPARADTWAPPGATGLGGATQVQVVTKRTDGGYPDDAVHVDKYGTPLPTSQTA